MSDDTGNAPAETAEPFGLCIGGAGGWRIAACGSEAGIGSCAVDGVGTDAPVDAVAAPCGCRANQGALGAIARPNGPDPLAAIMCIQIA